MTAQEVERILRRSLDTWGTNPRQAIRNHVQQICAHTDGTISVHVGVHKNGCGGET